MTKKRKGKTAPAAAEPHRLATAAGPNPDYVPPGAADDDLVSMGERVWRLGELIKQQTELMQSMQRHIAVSALSCARLMQIAEKENRLAGEGHRAVDHMGLVSQVEQALTRETMLRTLITDNDGSDDDENSGNLPSASGDH